MKNGFEIRFAGSGGQGLQLSAKILAKALNTEGKHVSLSQGFEPTSRGGLSRSDLVVGNEQPDYPLVTALDYLILLDQIGTEFPLSLIKPGCLIIADRRRVENLPEGDFSVHVLPLSETALSIGNERVTNIVALGALLSLSDICESDSLGKSVHSSVPERFHLLNAEALTQGAQIVSNS